MKKILIASALVLLLASMSSCKEKRCRCVTSRAHEADAISLVPLGNYANCSEMDRQWMAADSSGDLLVMKCHDEE